MLFSQGGQWIGGWAPVEVVMAKKQSPAQLLGAEILQALERRQGAGGAPEPFRQTADAAPRGISESELRESLAAAPLKGKVILAFDDDLDALAVLKADAARLATDERLLHTLVHRLCSQNFPVVSLDQCAALLAKSLRTPFKNYWKRRLTANQLPTFVKRANTGHGPATTLLDARFNLPEETLSKGLVQTLKRLREKGQGAYPATFAAVRSETAPEAAPELIRKARAVEPSRSQLVTLLKGDEEIVSLAEDRATVLASDAFFQRLLWQSTSASSPVATLKKLAAPLAKSDQSQFLELWGERIAQGRLPEVARLLPSKKATKPETRELHDPRHPLPWEVAATALVERLRRLRNDDAAYPATVDSLLEAVLPDAPAAIRKQALECESYRQHVQEIGAGIGRRVFLKEDGPRVAASLVGSVLDSLIKPDDQAIPLDKLAKGVPADLRDAFTSSLKERLEQGSLPQGLGALQVAKKWVLFRIADVLGGSSSGTAPTQRPPATTPAAPSALGNSSTETPSTPAGSDTFAHDFERAFGKIDGETGRRNFVKLLELRNALPQYDRPAFEEGLRRLRAARQFTLETSEGLNTSVTDEERQAAIVEAGSRYLYCSRIR